MLASLPEPLAKRDYLPVSRLKTDIAESRRCKGYTERLCDHRRGARLCPDLLSDAFSILPDISSGVWNLTALTSDQGPRTPHIHHRFSGHMICAIPKLTTARKPDHIARNTKKDGDDRERYSIMCTHQMWAFSGLQCLLYLALTVLSCGQESESSITTSLAINGALQTC